MIWNLISENSVGTDLYWNKGITRIIS
jgi:hypothetical protein